MKAFVALALIAGLFGLAGCSTPSPVAPSNQTGGVLVSKGYRTGQGDLGHFILQTAARFGKTVPPVENLPLIPGEWRYSEYDNSHHLKISLARQNYPVVKSFLDRFFGPARTERDDGYAIYGFTKPVNGGSIMVAVGPVDGDDVTWMYICPE